ncbi:MAG: pantothenate kinase [Saccharofermentans sp.]|nr:pantothenate kinase [Saccharofermentans sp.]
MMKINIGLDIGGSTTKIVGMRGKEIVAKEIVRAGDPVTSAFGAVGKLINDHGLKTDDIYRINITGVGSSYTTTPVFGIETVLVEEFISTGLGGLYLSGLDHAVVVSMGTGTAYLDASYERVKHIIGSGVGGGTLAGLCNAVLGLEDVIKLSDMAKEGSLTACDLTIGDISRKEIPGLPMDATASNFGKVADDLSREDKAAGIFNLVYQAIGSMSVLTSKICGLNDIVFTGQLTAIPVCKDLLIPFAKLYDANFVVPDNAEFATAIGSCLAGTTGEN